MNKILVIDDEIDILTLLEILFTTNNFIVKTMSNPSNFLEEIKDFFPDVILMDVNIGYHDGRDLCKLLKADIVHKHIPIILFSAHPDVKQTYTECGANDFIAKPFDVLNILAIVTKYLKAA
jgi:DNA-binding response OmpR family regulator